MTINGSMHVILGGMSISLLKVRGHESMSGTRSPCWLILDIKICLDFIPVWRMWGSRQSLSEPRRQNWYTQTCWCVNWLPSHNTDCVENEIMAFITHSCRLRNNKPDSISFFWRRFMLFVYTSTLMIWLFVCVTFHTWNTRSLCMYKCDKLCTICYIRIVYSSS